MSSETLNLTPQVYAYLLANSLREPKILEDLRIKTRDLPGAIMQISPEQGQFMRFLIELMNAKQTLDIGTFTGYSALSVALALPAGGKVIACEIDQKNAAIAQQYWDAAKVADKIELYLAPANDTLDQLIAEGKENTFDFAFIDADKRHYDDYYEKSLKLVRQSGLIAIDNVLWSGDLADQNKMNPTITILRTLNQKLLKDERVTISMIPIGDGLTLARKR